MIQAYFYLGNSYDNMYKPARKGEAENDGLLPKAVKNYEIAVQRETDPQRKKLALQYLAASYGTDKLNDPAKAEPVVRQMIQMDPKDTGSYYGLSKLYEDAGRFEEAEQALLQARDAVPSNPEVYLQLAGFYNKRDQFDKAVAMHEERAKLDPNNPEAFWTLAAFYENAARKDYRLYAGRQEAVHRARHRRRRQGAGDQAGLRRGHHLQEPAAPPAGARGKGSEEAEGTDRRSRQASQPRHRAEEAEDQGRRRLARTHPTKNVNETRQANT